MKSNLHNDNFEMFIYFRYTVAKDILKSSVFNIKIKNFKRAVVLSVSLGSNLVTGD